MGSTYQFPSGLNRWTGSDAPHWQDFVSDNRTLDENALWKSSYDIDGAVKEAGGIASYSMEKALYDPSGAVAAAGGIEEMIEMAVGQNEGFRVYSHQKNGTTHILTGNGDVMKFKATAAFRAGDTFQVNGEACTAQDTCGQPLWDNCFVAGAVTSCFRSGNVLCFKSDGAALNFKIVGGTSCPTVPAPNTFWINTSIPITGYVLYPTTPTGAQGLVWIQNTTSSPYSFNALKSEKYGDTAVHKKSIGAFPSTVWIYDGGAWVNMTSDTQLYHNGAWVSLYTYIYDAGNQFTSITGGYTFTAITGGTANSSGATYLGASAWVSGTAGYSSMTTTNLIDVTNFNTLKFDSALYPTGNTTMLVGLSASRTSAAFYNFPTVYANVTGSAVKTYSIDISSLTGSYYFIMTIANSTTASSGTGYVYKAWFE